VSLPTLTDLKAHVNVSSTADDGELTDMLDAAVDVVEGIIGPITSQTVTETHYGLCSDVLVLRRMPVADLLSVGYRSGATTTDLLLTDYELDADTGLVRLTSGGRFAGNYRVTYSVGRPSVPAAVRLAILIIAGHLWETQRGTAPSALALQDPNAGFGDTASVGLGFAIPNRAQELLAPYSRPSIA
jgi:uncharacterized phiE125 gp8 family phage protein